MTWLIHEREKASSGGRRKVISISWRKWNAPSEGTLKRGKVKVSHELWKRMAKFLRFRTVREQVWVVSQIGFPGKQIPKQGFEAGNLLMLGPESMLPQKDKLKIYPPYLCM